MMRLALMLACHSANAFVITPHARSLQVFKPRVLAPEPAMALRDNLQAAGVATLAGLVLLSSPMPAHAKGGGHGGGGGGHSSSHHSSSRRTLHSSVSRRSRSSRSRSFSGSSSR